VRIAIFSNAYKPAISGVVTSISLFRKGLEAAGHAVHIFCPEYEDYEDPEPYVFRFPALDLSESWNVSIVVPIRNLMEPAVRGVQPALIHSQHPILMGDLAISFRRRLGVPLVFTFHTQYDKYAQLYSPLAPRLAERITDELVGRYLRHCDHIITPTESIRQKVMETWAPRAGITVVPTPVDIPVVDEAEVATVRHRLAPEGERLLVYVGRLAPEKGLDLLLEAFHELIQDRSDVRLALVGRGPSEETLRSMAGELGIAGKVSFTGAVPHEEVAPYYVAGDLFVFTSQTETQGLVLIEAMAAGRPVVAVQAPGPADILAEGGGVLVEPDPAAFARAVAELLREEGRRWTLAKEARRAARRYSIAGATEGLLRAYQAALDNFIPKERGP